jgi:hypothetical protein
VNQSVETGGRGFQARRTLLTDWDPGAQAAARCCRGSMLLRARGQEDGCEPVCKPEGGGSRHAGSTSLPGFQVRSPPLGAAHARGQEDRAPPPAGPRPQIRANSTVGHACTGMGRPEQNAAGGHLILRFRPGLSLTANCPLQIHFEIHCWRRS